MKCRRDSFARESYIPERMKGDCSFCGRQSAYRIRVEPDGGRDVYIKGQFCSWSCAEHYHNVKIGG